MTVSTGAREWVLYRFWDASGTLLYIGQTCRDAIVRWLEHIRKQWWSGQIATMQVDPITYLSLASVLAAERHAIRTVACRPGTVPGRPPPRADRWRRIGA